MQSIEKKKIFLFVWDVSKDEHDEVLLHFFKNGNEKRSISILWKFPLQITSRCTLKE